MTPAVRVGLLGGTLDPIHVGHIETARAARRALDLDHVDVLPSNLPPHRTGRPLASGYHRFAMTALAVDGNEGLRASDLELSSPGRSYTSETLTRVRQAQGLDVLQIFFITGADAFAEIATWHRYPEVLDLANFIVVSRPGSLVDQLRHLLPDLSERMTSLSIHQPAAGRQPPAATRTSIFLVEARTPDVSSTDIRRRLAEGRPIRGLVPDAVERHILRHGLYSRHQVLTADHLHDEI